jgi:Mrp family chromosome partitioning ATPase
LLEQASSQFDWVILDGPPIMGIADAPILASTAAATMLVVQSGKTRVGSARAAVKRLRFARAQLVGGLLTQFDAKVTGYGHDLEGYYAYGVSYGAPKQ